MFQLETLWHLAYVATLLLPGAVFLCLGFRRRRGAAAFSVFFLGMLLLIAAASELVMDVAFRGGYVSRMAERVGRKMDSPAYDPRIIATEEAESGGVYWYGKETAGNIARAEKKKLKTILFLGDSITFGVHVPRDETFAGRLERAVNRGLSSPEWQSVNIAMPAYSTRDMRFVFDKFGGLLKPKIVIMSFFYDDASPYRMYNGYLFSDFVYRCGDRLCIDALPVPAGLNRVLFFSSNAYQCASYIAMKRKEQSIVLLKGKLGAWDRELGEIQKQCESIDARLLVLVFPWLGGEAPNYYESEKDRVLREYAEGRFKGRKIRYVEVKAFLAGEDYGKLRLDEAHYNAAGHALIAGNLEKYLREAGWLDPSK